MKPAVLFDLNGVLIDDEALHERAFANVLGKRDVWLTHAQYMQYFAGKSDRDGFNGFGNVNATNLRDELDKLMIEKSAAYETLAARGLQVYDGAALLVRSLYGLGHDLGLVTGSYRREAVVALRHMGIVDLFKVIVTAEDIVRGKPSPESFLLAAKTLNRIPRECVVIEDSPSGVIAARRAGMHCIAVASTHKPAELKDASDIVGSIVEVSESRINELSCLAVEVAELGARLPYRAES